MKNCDLRTLQYYLDGELPETRLGSLEAHLCACPTCRRELDRLRALRALLNDFPDLLPPAAIKFAVTSQASRRCSQIIPLINSYLEGALTTAQREGVVLHFALCPSCREELAAQRQVRLLTGTLPEALPPARVRQTVQEALRQRRRERLAPVRPWQRVRKVATAAALAGVALALAWVFPNLSLNQNPTTGAGVKPAVKKTSPAELMAKSQPKPPVEERVAEAPPAPPVVVAEPAPVEPARENTTGAPPRNSLSYRHVSSPGRIVEISSRNTTPEENAAEIAARPESNNNDEPEPVYTPPAFARSADSAAIASARQDLLRASEQYEVLQMERALSHLPGPEHLISTPINDNKKPMNEPDASKFGPGSYA